VDSGSGDEENIFKVDVDPSSDNEMQSANAHSLNGGTSNTVDRMGGNGPKTKEVSFIVANVNGCATVKEKRNNGWVHYGVQMLVGSLVSDAGEVDSVGV
jgi:hypothetical protein